MADPRPPLHVLFVCVENSCRSQMAEAFAHLRGAEHVRAFSAGSAPSGRVNPKAIEAMHAHGYDLRKHHSKSLADVPRIEWDFVVTMGCGDECPHVLAKAREDWPVPQPKDMGPGEFAGVRDEVERRVTELLERSGALAGTP